MKWISVKDRLPKKEEQVIGYVKGHHCPVQMLGYGIPYGTWYCWVEDVGLNYEVTHWMSLPNLP